MSVIETTVRPTATEIRRMLETELSMRARIAYTFLLLFDLCMGAAIVSLWVTERGLPPRTHIAFGVMTVIAISWATFFIWTLSRRKVLLARHRVVSGRLAVAFTAAYTVGAALIATMQANMRGAGIVAAALGGIMLALAVAWLVRSRRRLAKLLDRKRVLEAAAAIFACMFSIASNGQTLTPAGFEIHVPHAPHAARALGADHLVYEVHVTNFGAQTRLVVELSVLNQPTQGVLGTWKGEELERRAGRISTSREKPLTLHSGERVVFFLWLTTKSAITSIRHAVVSTALDSADPYRVVGATVAVDRPAVATLVPPVGAGRWVAVRGPSNGSGHRRSLVPLDGQVRVPQRFAVDWARLGNDGRLFEGDGSRNEQWYGYDATVTSAAAGRVVKVVDGIADRDPRTAVADGHTRESVAGNVVIVESDSAQFMVYAHLRPGSIVVKMGDRIAAGQEIGRVGNSGHSLAPHLHFHVADAPDALASEGLPFALSEFELIGRVDSMPGLIGGGSWQSVAQRPARDVIGEMPLENMVIALK